MVIGLIFLYVFGFFSLHGMNYHSIEYVVLSITNFENKNVLDVSYDKQLWIIKLIAERAKEMDYVSGIDEIRSLIEGVETTDKNLPDLNFINIGYETIEDVPRQIEYDIITCFFNSHHIPMSSFEDMLSKLAHLLKQGGEIIFTVEPSDRISLGLLAFFQTKALFDESLFQDSFVKIYKISKKSLLDLLRRCGFELISYKDVFENDTLCVDEKIKKWLWSVTCSCMPGVLSQEKKRFFNQYCSTLQSLLTQGFRFVTTVVHAKKIT